MERRREIRPRENAVEQIEWFIKSNHLKPHAKMPGEREMCEMWHVNRSTLRTAIKRLAEENYLYIIKGSGTYVAPPKLVRNLQDGKSTSESIRGTGHFLWTEVLNARVISCDKYLSQKLDMSQGEPVFYLRRLRMRDQFPLMIESSYLNMKYCQGIEKHNFNEESLYKVLKELGNELKDGQERIGITYATEEEAALLKVPEGQHMFFQRGHIKEADGKPIEYFKIVARADQLQFTSTLTMRTTLTERGL